MILVKHVLCSCVLTQLIVLGQTNELSMITVISDIEMI